MFMFHQAASLLLPGTHQLPVEPIFVPVPYRMTEEKKLKRKVEEKKKLYTRIFNDM